MSPNSHLVSEEKWRGSRKEIRKRKGGGEGESGKEGGRERRKGREIGASIHHLAELGTQ